MKRTLITINVVFAALVLAILLGMPKAQTCITPRQRWLLQPLHLWRRPCRIAVRTSMGHRKLCAPPNRN